MPNPPVTAPLVQQVQPVRPVYVDEKQEPAKGSHVYLNREEGYVPKTYVHQEYPKMVYRHPTADEMQEKRENMPKDIWMDPSTDLLQLTGQNSKRDVKSYELYITKNIEQTVNSKKEEDEAAKEGFTNLIELSKQPKVPIGAGK